MTVVFEKGKKNPMDTKVIEAVIVDKTLELKAILNEAGIDYNKKLGEKKLQDLVDGLE